MEKLLEIMPILLLGMGQLMLAVVCINQERRIKRLKDETIQNLALLFATRKDLNLPIIPEILKHEEEAEYGEEEQ